MRAVFCHHLKAKEETAKWKAASEASLLDFVRFIWPVLEPEREFVTGWVPEAICIHLEAVTAGEITRLIINVPPGTSKSLITDVCWPAWEWGPQRMPHLRYVAAAYGGHLTRRDNIRFRRVITSRSYRECWGDVFNTQREEGTAIRVQQGIVQVANDKTGWKFATSIGGVGTGERGDRFIMDDPNNPLEAESEAVRFTTNTWATEVVPDRLNDQSKSAIVLIQQRTHEEDVSGLYLAKELGYTHLMIPMRYESDRHCVTVLRRDPETGEPIEIWQDPRGVDEEGNAVSGTDGELAWPERFSEEACRELEKAKGPYSWSGQFQQRPEPRGGGIIKRDWWQMWEQPKHPLYIYKLASLDTAYGEDEENDFNALTVLGVFALPSRVDEMNGVMLAFAWQGRLQLNKDLPAEHVLKSWGIGPQTPANLRESILEEREALGLVEKVHSVCTRFGVDELIIEDKTRGREVHNEIARQFKQAPYQVTLIPVPGGKKSMDKVARANSVVPLYTNGLIWAPGLLDPESNSWQFREWAQRVIDQVSLIPRAAHDDLADTVFHGLRYLRDRGVLSLAPEARERAKQAAADYFSPRPRRQRGRSLYPC